MNNYKYLFKNVGLLTISNFGSKILAFLLVPLYTSVLTTSEYGIYDLINTSVLLLIPILTLDIVDSIMRFTIDKENSPKEVLSIGLNIEIYGILILFIAILFNNFFNIIAINESYTMFFIIMFVTNIFYQTLSQFARGIDRVSDLAISGFVNSLTMLGFNVMFLLYFKLGIKGFFYANILSLVLPSLYLSIRLRIIEYIGYTKISSPLGKKMITYSMPLILTSISWWVVNVSDRYAVTIMSGISANGIYSVAYKIPSLLNVIQVIFLQAWQISAVKSFDSNDEDGFFSNIYNSCNMILVFVCAFIIIIAKPMALILFSKDFYAAWEYVPMLTIAVVFNTMSGFIGGVFSAVRDSKIFALSTVIGALINIVLNFILISFVGTIGAAVATAIASFAIWIIRYINAKKYISMKINIGKDLIAYFLLLVQAVVLIETKGVLTYIIEILILIILVIMYYKTLKTILLAGKKYIRR